jgi:hypothetical protein
MVQNLQLERIPLMCVDVSIVKRKACEGVKVVWCSLEYKSSQNQSYCCNQLIMHGLYVENSKGETIIHDIVHPPLPKSH